MEKEIKIHQRIKNIRNQMDYVNNQLNIVESELQQLKEEPKPQFKEGNWLYYYSKRDKETALFRFKKFEDKLLWYSEGYFLMDEGTIFDYNDHNGSTDCWMDEKLWIEGATLATIQQIEQILHKVWMHKGGKLGITIKWDKKYEIKDSNIYGIGYNPLTDCFYINNVCVYKGYEDKKWATIIPKEKTEIEKFIDWLYDKHIDTRDNMKVELYQKFLASQKSNVAMVG